MTDQAQRLEIATVRAEIGSNITYRFNNDAIDAGGIPTESGDIKNLKLVIKEIEDKASVSSSIYTTVAEGLAATPEGGIFLVQSDEDDEIYVVWRKVSGAAVDTGKRALSSQAVKIAADSAQSSAQASEASAAIALEAAEDAAAWGPINNATNIVYVDPAGGATVVQALSGSQGSNLVGHVAAGASTTERTIQGKLRDIIARADYTSDSAFNTAKVGKLAIDAAGNISGSVLPTGGGTAIALADTARDAKSATAYQFPIGPRPLLRYGSANTVVFTTRTMPMGEFRFQGSYTGGRARVLPMATGVASLVGTGLGAESTKSAENWYAAFAVANAADTTATIKAMPFLRVGSVSGSVVTLNKAGEGIHTLQAKSYAWPATNNLQGVKCLIISEGGASPVFSGRTVTITANNATTVTLDSVGTLAFGDFLLPAPPGYAEFGYMGTFYNDTAEVRNIYDTVLVTKSYGIQLATNSDGAQANMELNFSGYISPLATGFVLSVSTSLSTSSTGEMAENFSPDNSGHTVASTYFYKQLTTSMPAIDDGLEIPFLYPFKCYLTTGGNLQASRANAKLSPRGWFEA